MSPTPEEKARQTIDSLLAAAGWLVQDRANANIDVGPGVEIRECALGHGFGEADYLLFADGNAVGVVEAKKEGSTVVGVEIDTQKYSEGIRAQHNSLILRRFPLSIQRALLNIRQFWLVGATAHFWRSNAGNVSFQIFIYLCVITSDITDELATIRPQLVNERFALKSTVDI